MSDTITITGNIATPPEYKRTPAGLPITTFRLASGQRRFDKQTETWVDGETNWYTVSAYRGLAEHAYHSLHKGERVLLTGRLRLRSWETETSKGWAAEIDADAIGHDLLFGTSQFHRSTQTPAQSAPTTGDSWATQTEGQTIWTNPADALTGADAADDPALEISGSAVAEPELALVGDAPF